MQRSTYITSILIVTPLLLTFDSQVRKDTYPSQAIELTKVIAKEHTIILPTFRPDHRDKCRVEAIAYAAALQELKDARRAADEAYRRWYECESQGGGDPRPGEANARQPLPPPPELSVLVDSSVREHVAHEHSTDSW